MACQFPGETYTRYSIRIEEECSEPEHGPSFYSYQDQYAEASEASK